MSQSMGGGSRDLLFFIVCGGSCKQCEYGIEMYEKLVTAILAYGLVMRQNVFIC